MKETGYKKFLLLWAGQMVSAIGGGLTSFGLGVYVFEQTGSAASMALVTLLAFLPTLVLSVPAGVLADRYDRRLMMMLGDGLSALGILYILICMLRGGAALWQICVGVLVSSVFSALLEPAYRATVSDLLSREEYSRASGLVSLAGSARYLISPLLAGLLLAVSDIKLLLVIDICTFFLTVIVTGAVKRGLAAKPPELRESYAPLLFEDDPAVTPIVKAADKLSAHIKCIEELKAGNAEFESAAAQTRAALDALHLPELDWFLAHCMDAFSRNLDELE